MHQPSQIQNQTRDPDKIEQKFKGEMILHGRQVQFFNLYECQQCGFVSKHSASRHICKNSGTFRIAQRGKGIKNDKMCCFCGVIFVNQHECSSKNFISPVIKTMRSTQAVKVLSQFYQESPKMTRFQRATILAHCVVKTKKNLLDDQFVRFCHAKLGKKNKNVVIKNNFVASLGIPQTRFQLLRLIASLFSYAQDQVKRFDGVDFLNINLQGFRDLFPTGVTLNQIAQGFPNFTRACWIYDTKIIDILRNSNNQNAIQIGSYLWQRINKGIQTNYLPDTQLQYMGFNSQILNGGCPFTLLQGWFQQNDQGKDQVSLFNKNIFMKQFQDGLGIVKIQSNQTLSCLRNKSITTQMAECVRLWMNFQQRCEKFIKSNYRKRKQHRQNFIQQIKQYGQYADQINSVEKKKEFKIIQIQRNQKKSNLFKKLNQISSILKLNQNLRNLNIFRNKTAFTSAEVKELIKQYNIDLQVVRKSNILRSNLIQQKTMGSISYQNDFNCVFRILAKNKLIYKISRRSFTQAQFLEICPQIQKQLRLKKRPDFKFCFQKYIEEQFIQVLQNHRYRFKNIGAPVKDYNRNIYSIKYEFEQKKSQSFTFRNIPDQTILVQFSKSAGEQFQEDQWLILSLIYSYKIDNISHLKITLQKIQMHVDIQHFIKKLSLNKYNLLDFSQIFKNQVTINKEKVEIKIHPYIQQRSKQVQNWKNDISPFFLHSEIETRKKNCQITEEKLRYLNKFQRKKDKQIQNYDQIYSFWRQQIGFKIQLNLLRNSIQFIQAAQQLAKQQRKIYDRFENCKFNIYYPLYIKSSIDELQNQMKIKYYQKFFSFYGEELFDNFLNQFQVFRNGSFERWNEEKFLQYYNQYYFNQGKQISAICSSQRLPHKNSKQYKQLVQQLQKKKRKQYANLNYKKNQLSIQLNKFLIFKPDLNANFQLEKIKQSETIDKIQYVQLQISDSEQASFYIPQFSRKASQNKKNFQKLKQQERKNKIILNQNQSKKEKFKQFLQFLPTRKPFNENKNMKPYSSNSTPGSHYFYYISSDIICHWQEAFFFQQFYKQKLTLTQALRNVRNCQIKEKPKIQDVQFDQFENELNQQQQIKSCQINFMFLKQHVCSMCNFNFDMANLICLNKQCLNHNKQTKLNQQYNKYPLIINHDRKQQPILFTKNTLLPIKNNIRNVVSNKYTYSDHLLFRGSLDYNIIHVNLPKLSSNEYRINQLFQQIDYLPLQIKQSSPVKGLGVFATKSLKKNQIISSYAGQVFKFHQFQGKNDSIVDIGFIGDQLIMIVPFTTANCGRYFNSAPKKQCNLKVVWLTYIYNQQKRFGLFLATSRAIKAGQQLVWNYGDNYMNTLEDK